MAAEYIRLYARIEELTQAVSSEAAMKLQATKERNDIDYQLKAREVAKQALTKNVIMCVGLLLFVYFVMSGRDFSFLGRRPARGGGVVGGGGGGDGDGGLVLACATEDGEVTPGQSLTGAAMATINSTNGDGGGGGLGQGRHTPLS